jgi:hypothetical protein
LTFLEFIVDGRTARRVLPTDAPCFEPLAAAINTRRRAVLVQDRSPRS